jgi:tetratricopeptide (TPR) repeat protein
MHGLFGPTVVVIGDHVVRFEPFDAGPVVPAPEPMPKPEREWRPTLVRLQSATEEHFPLIGAVSKLGRSSRSDIQLVDGSISRFHAEIRMEAESVILVDLSSANGTLVNGRHVAQPVALSEGDVIQLGDIPLLFTGIPSTIDRNAVAIPQRATTRPNETLYFTAAALAVLVIVVAAMVIWSSLSGRAPTTNELHTARASAATAEGRGDWSAAESAWSTALALAPQDAEILRSLDEARQARAAQQEFAACQTHLEVAQHLQSGPPEPAIAAFVETQTCFDAVRPEGLFGPEARNLLRTSVTPPLVELHRLAGASAVASGRFDAALDHLRTARRLQDARRDINQATHSALVTNELRAAYLVAAEAAHSSSDWGRASSLFSQANELSPLDSEQSERLEEARRGSLRNP